MDLDNFAKEYIDRSIEITKRALGASPFKMSEINEIIMVGGQTRMPAIVEAVKNLFGKMALLNPQFGVHISFCMNHLSS